MSSYVSKPHKLIITCSDIEEGILDYDIIHDPECPKEIVPFAQIVNGELVEHPTETYEQHTCGVAWEIDSVGIDELREALTNEIGGYPDEGEYMFEAWSAYDAFTMDWDGGLRLL